MIDIPMRTNKTKSVWALATALTCFLGLWTTISASWSKDARDGGDVLQTLRRGHPRLYVLDSELPGIKSLAATHPQVKGWYVALEARAERMLTEPPVEHKLIGPRLLSQSRAALDRISTLAFLYRLDADPRKAQRARQEMLTAAHFDDWNPSHFLDVAEMTHALALGYDWLYDYFSPADRAVVRQAILEKGLQQGLAAYEKHAWWTETRFNWNQVCNGGLTLGALAVAEEEPDVARRIIDLARGSIVIAMRAFAPDGGWEEGPGYWNYSTEYTAYYLAGIESALGTDFGISKMPGFADTGRFRMHAAGPLGLTFNFADAHPKAGTAAQMFWLARAFERPLFAQHERGMVRDHPTIFHMIWSPGSVVQNPVPTPARDAVFRAVKAAFFRSDWNDPAAAYLAFKGGDNAVNHSHLDLGTFVYDELGKRWALDLGSDDYDLPGYFGKLRWTYYRLRTEGHNTLTVDGQNQNVSAKAPLLAFLSTLERAYAVADLTEGYTPQLQRALRGVALLHRRALLVQDEVKFAEPVRLVWNFHTPAKITLAGSSALLEQDGQHIAVHILSPKGAGFGVISSDPPPPQAQQPDVHNLIILLNRTKRSVRIAVLLSPVDDKSRPVIEPLAKWISQGKLNP